MGGVLALALLLIVGIAGAPLAQSSDPPAGSQTQGPPAVPVSVITVAPTSLKQFIQTEGTAQAVRREILQFDRSGRVVEIGLDTDGEPLREGSAVKGPDPDGDDEHEGTLIALLADGELAETLAAREAQERAAKGRAAAAQATVQQAQDRLDAAQKELSRTQTLVSQGVMPRKNLDEAQAKVAEAQGALSSAKAELGAAQADADAARAQRQGIITQVQEGSLRAPMDGVIALMNVREGDRVGPLPAGLSDAEMMRRAPAVVIDPSAYQIVAQVPWSQAINLKPGQPAEVTWAGLGLFAELDKRRAAGESTDDLPVADATVWAVAPSVLPDTRAIRVRLRTTAGAEAMRDGLFVSIRIVSDTLENVIAVPREAVRRDGGDDHVFVLEQAGDDGVAVARRQTVRTGAIGARLIRITDGLKGGETLVTRGQAMLVDGASVRVVAGGGQP